MKRDLKNLVRPLLPLGISTLVLVVLLCGLSRTSRATEAEPVAPSVAMARERARPSSLDYQTGVSVCRQTQNLVLNPGFEQGIGCQDHWCEVGDCDFQANKAEHDPSISARIGKTSDEYDCMLFTPIEETPVEPGRRYDYSAWMRATLASGEAYLRIIFYTREGDDWVWKGTAQTEPVVGDMDWITVTGSITAPLDAEYARVDAYLPTSTVGVARFDNVFFGLATCLEVNKCDDPDPVVPGEMLTYTITCANTGRETATDVEVIEEYDDYVSFVDSQPSPSFSDNIWRIGDLPPSATYPITIWVQVSSNTEERAWLFNRVTILSEETQVLTDPIHHIEPTALITDGCAIYLDPTQAEKTGNLGSQTDYEFTLGNAGSCTGTMYLLTSSSRGWDVITSSVPYTLAPGDFVEDVMVSLLVPGDALSDTVDVTIITATQECGPPCNRTAIATGTFTTTVESWGSVALATDHTGSADPGSLIAHTHTLTNATNTTQAVILTLDSSQGCSATVEPTITESLTPWTDSMVVAVTVSVPGDALSGTVCTTVMTAAGATIGRDTVTITLAVNHTPGVELSSNHAGDSAPDTIINYTHILTNSGNGFDVFDLTHHSSQSWMVMYTTPVSVSHYETATVLVSITVPTGAISSTVDSTVITATSRTSSAAQTGVIATTTVAQWGDVALGSGRTGSADPGNVIIYTHTLTNTTNATQTINLTADSSQGCTPTVELTITESLAPWTGSTVVTVTVPVPGDALSGTACTVVITAAGAVVGEDTITDTTAVELVGSVALEPAACASSIPSGGIIVYTHTLTNVANITQTVMVSLSQGCSATVDSIIAGGLPPWDGSIVVTVTVPVPGDALSGTVCTTAVTATGTVTGQAMASDITSVGLVGGVTLVPTGRISSVIPGDIVVYTHTLTNTTNATQIVNLTADSSHGCIPTMELTTTGSLPPWDGSTVVTVTVLVPNDVPSGTVCTTVITATGTVTGQDTATDTTIALAVPIRDVTVSGPATGNVNVPYVFTANVGPTTATAPITYVWQATNKIGVVTTTDAISHTVSYTWSEAGTYIITATITNAVSTVSRTRMITIEWFEVNLPLVTHCWPPIESAPALDDITPPNDDATYTVSWSAVDQASTYILQEVASIGGVTKTYTTTNTFYAIESRCMEHYHYRVRACNSCMCSGWSNVQSVETRWECEHNNSCPPQEDDGPLDSGLTYYGTFTSTADSKDYFYFDISVAHNVELWLAHIPVGYDYDLALRDANCKLVDDYYSNNPGNASEHILTDDLPVGRYHVQVYYYQKAGSLQPYHLRVVYR
ncbi:MAG: PKD domain-containing protein [Chloroflexota bacterium]|nr:PKD domain-containing protein [Chloroflexota bacterium]